jgi:hypothetical protein
MEILRKPVRCVVFGDTVSFFSSLTTLCLTQHLDSPGTMWFAPMLTYWKLQGIMYLPEEHPGAFSFFVDWLYRSPLPAGHTQPYLANLYHLWIFATKICLTKLADDVMDRIQDTCKEYDLFSSDELLKEIWGLTKTDSKLRCWAIDLKVYYLFQNKEPQENDYFFCHIHDNRYEDLLKLLQNDFDLFKTFLIKFEYMAQHVDENDVFYDPRRDREHDESYCSYHSHKEEDCVAALSKLKRRVSDSKKGKK